MRFAIGIACAGAAVFASISASSAVRTDAPPLRGTVVGVVDTATLRVRLSNRKLVPVRLLGVRAHPNSCVADAAKAGMRRLSVGKRIRLSGDGGRIRRVEGRIVGHVTLPGNRDLGRIALLRGLVSVGLGRPRTAQLPSDREAQRLARTKLVGIWSCSDPATEDRVTADLLRPRTGGGDVRLIVDAWSRADGEHPRGLFRVTATTPEGVIKISGRVECLTVSANRATVGGVVEQTTHSGAPVDSGYRIHLTDHGTPGASRDSNFNVGHARVVPCLIRDVAEIAITEGEVTVADATPAEEPAEGAEDG